MTSHDESRSPAWWRQGCLGGFILAPLLVGLLVVGLIYRDEFYVTQPSPERAPDPPVAVERLVGVDSFGFGSSVVVVEGADGVIYYHQWQVGWDVWSFDPAHEEFEAGIECGPEALAELTVAAGPLVECRADRVWTEGCNSPAAAYALATDGSVWLLLHLQPCSRAFLPSLCICLPLAALASVLLWLFVKVVLRRPAE